MTDTPVFTISQTFAAPRQALWAAWTVPDKIAAWLGPKGSTGRVLRQDFRVGGEILSHINTPWGMEMYGKYTYTRIDPPNELHWLHGFSDADGNRTRHPMSPTWPLVLLTTVRFEDDGAGTKVTLTWTPHEANALEMQTFTAGMDGMKMGWGGSFEALAAFLAETPP